MGLDLIVYERQVYTLFDMLADIGGLSSILVTFIKLLLAAWNYNSLDNLMVSRLFKIQKQKEQI